MMYLQEEQISIKIDGCTFVTHTPRKVPGQPTKAHYHLDDVAIEGWYDGVAPRRNAEPRVTSSGDFKVPGTLASRVISLTGVANANSADELQKMRDNFTSICNNGNYSKITVDTSSTGPRYTDVGLGGKPIWERKSDKLAIFKLELYAPEPEIYGDARIYVMNGVNYNGGMSFPLQYPISYGVKTRHEIQNVVNYGNTDSWPGFFVYGNLPNGFTINDGNGNRVTYKEFVTGEAPVVLDFAKGNAKQKGNDKTSFLTSRDWFSIPRNQSKIIQPTLSFPNGVGQGWMEIWVRDTWI